MRFAICDDDTNMLDYLRRVILEWGRPEINQIEMFPSAEAFLFGYEENKKYDVILLDIEMNKMNGVELAKRIRAFDKTVQIIFVTGYSEYISEGYDVAALHYLMKPVIKEKLFEVLDRAKEKLSENERYLCLKIDSEMILVPLHEIRYIEVERNYVTVHADDNYTVRQTLSEMEQELDDRFFRASRSFIINLHKIRKATKSEVVLIDNTSIPLPRNAYQALNRAIIERL